MSTLQNPAPIFVLCNCWILISICIDSLDTCIITKSSSSASLLFIYLLSLLSLNSFAPHCTSVRKLRWPIDVICQGHVPPRFCLRATQWWQSLNLLTNKPIVLYDHHSQMKVFSWKNQGHYCTKKFFEWIIGVQLLYSFRKNPGPLESWLIQPRTKTPAINFIFGHAFFTSIIVWFWFFYILFQN